MTAVPHAASMTTASDGAIAAIGGGLAVLLVVWLAARDWFLLWPQRRRLGVVTSARLARPSELRPLFVGRRRAGRFILGRVGRHVLATEAPTRRGRRARRQGDRSSVAIIGPTRCGKTAAAITGILQWSGPAILSSVKADLMGATIEWRRTLGDVRVFDPTGATGRLTHGWSPLRGAATISGAQQATRALVDAGPRGGVENLDFFLRLAEQLLWPHLYIAATHGRAMHDVVRWIHSQTSPDDTTTDLGDLLTSAVRGSDLGGHGSGDAHQALAGIWQLDRRTRASAYATAQTLLGAWTDPGVAAASELEELDLDWLTSGANTLYICAPLHHQQRLAEVFGGLLGDFVNQAYERFTHTNESLPPTLLVLDEAANTPTRWLPQVASTCAGIGLLLVTIWQSKAQLDAAYGRLADSVLTNHGTKIIFSGVSDLPTLEYASRLIGDEDVVRHSQSVGDHEHRRTRSFTPQTMPLMPSHVLRQARRGTALLVHGTLPPAQMMTIPYYQQRRLRRRGTNP